MKRILLISHDATRTGAPILLLSLATVLVKTGRYDIRFLINRPNHQILDRFKKFNYFLASRSGRFFWMARRLLTLFGLWRPEWIYSQTAIRAAVKDVDVVIANTLTNGDVITTVRQYYKGPIVTYVHELAMAANYFTTPKNLEVVLKNSELFLVPSQAVENFLKEKLRVSPVAMLPYFIPKQVTNSLPERVAKTFVVGGGGTVDWRKGPDLFLQVAYQVFLKNPEIDMKFMWKGARGGTELERLKHDVMLSGLHDKISFQEVSDDVQTFYSGIDVLLLTSREDPYPLVVLEAADFARPTICFDKAGGAPEFVKKSGGGVVVPYLDVQAAVKTLLTFYEDKMAILAMGISARNMLQETHQSEQFVIQYFDGAVKRFF